MAWYSFTGHAASDPFWEGFGGAYDDNLSTWAYNEVPPLTPNYAWLYLTVSPPATDVVQVGVNLSSNPMRYYRIDVKLGGTWMYVTRYRLFGPIEPFPAQRKWERRYIPWGYGSLTGLRFHFEVPGGLDYIQRLAVHASEFQTFEPWPPPAVAQTYFILG